MFARGKYVKQMKKKSKEKMYITTLIDFSLKNSEKVFFSVKNMITCNIVWQRWGNTHVRLNQKPFKH